MDIPVSDHLFHDKDLSTLHVRVEKQMAQKVQKAADDLDVSTQQMLRYVINVGWSVVERRRDGGDDERERRPPSDETKDTIVHEIRNAVDRLKTLQDRQRALQDADDRHEDDSVDEPTDDPTADREPTNAVGSEPATPDAANADRKDEARSFPDDGVRMRRHLDDVSTPPRREDRPEDRTGDRTDDRTGEDSSEKDDATSMFDIASDADDT